MILKMKGHLHAGSKQYCHELCLSHGGLKVSPMGLGVHGDAINVEICLCPLGWSYHMLWTDLLICSFSHVYPLIITWRWEIYLFISITWDVSLFLREDLIICTPQRRVRKTFSILLLNIVDIAEKWHSGNMPTLTKWKCGVHLYLLSVNVVCLYSKQNALGTFCPSLLVTSWW